MQQRTCPKQWSDITVGQFVEFASIDFDNSNGTDILIQQASIIADIPYSEIEEMGTNEFENLLSNINFIYQPIPKKIKNQITIDGKTLSMIDLRKQIIVAEYIDLENFFTTNFIDNFKLILAVMFKIIIVPGDKFYPDKLEEYGDYIYVRQHVFDDIPVTDVYGIINYYSTWRKEFHNQFKSWFPEPDEEKEEEKEDLDEMENLTGREKSELLKEIEREKNMKKWAWESFLLRLSQNDETKIEAVLKFNLYFAMYFLSAKMELNIDQ